ncbi:MAG: ankyrin repeat domain-containing protein [Sedimentisphaerales bacterium]|nr:ankyrin repeat domain-containing protein [Sedimentisphaerales bacterium]
MKRAILSILSVSFLLVGGRGVLAQDAANPTKSLFMAAADGDIQQLNLHIARKADMNKADERGTPPLCYAADAGQLEAVKVLLAAGAQVNAKGINGRTPLLGAAQSGHTGVVLALLAAGADPKLKDDNKTTPLHVAAAFGHTEVVQALIKAGADVNAEDRMSQTPLMLASRRQQTEIVDLLKQSGAKEPVALRPGMSPYGDDGAPGSQMTQPVAATAPVQVELDPNAVRGEIKAFPGLAAVLQAVDDKSEVEQKGWIQRRVDTRTSLLRSVEKQFDDELALIKQTATDEKATKTIPAVDDLAAKRKLRYAAVGDAVREAIREERRAAMEQNTDTTGTGRVRGGRTGRRGTTEMMGGAQSPYGNPGATPSRASARREPNLPPIDGDTRAQIDAWVNGKPESKPELLEAVHLLDLAELEGLRTIAAEEQAKKTAATISGVMLARQERVAKIREQWTIDEERQRKLQERKGTQPGTYPERGQRGTGGRRYR